MRRRRQLDSLSLGEARRIAIAAQGADRGAARDVATRADVRRLINRLGVLQIDSVNVLARAHTLPIYARLGVYDRADLDTLAYGGKRRSLFEYWGHAASLMPVEMQPLFRWRMQDARAGRNIYTGLARFAEANKTLIRDLKREIAQRGPSAVGDFASHANREVGWWGWSDAKCALEWLFWTGQLTTATRRATFERIYDLPERVLPDHILAAPTPSEANAKRALIAHSARALGIGTEVCLRDYYRLDAAATKRAIRDLVEAGTLRAVTVEGWEKPAFVHAEARLPKTVAARALLGPFDPLVWHRDRAERLFGARIRIELYTPKHKRTHGYYVLPFLLGDRVVGRVDLKADRDAETLQVLSAHCEPGIAAEAWVEALADEVRLMARWLGLPRLETGRTGDAAAALQRVL
ncbi:MAG: crosslink repair DNA glycosylase YcaQ family protein [Hyphomicrobiaceae bacterium]|nr:crosslink repair DNA glycosylase YcaQ family protein [Hyphomicrobiaceae bacterium]